MTSYKSSFADTTRMLTNDRAISVSRSRLTSGFWPCAQGCGCIVAVLYNTCSYTHYGTRRLSSRSCVLWHQSNRGEILRTSRQTKVRVWDGILARLLEVVELVVDRIPS